MKEQTIDVNEFSNGKGHNSTSERLRSFIARIERMEAEKSELAQDIKEIYSEAKGVGFDTKIMKIIIRRRKLDADKRSETDSLVETYEAAIDGTQFDLFEKENVQNEEAKAR